MTIITLIFVVLSHLIIHRARCPIHRHPLSFSPQQLPIFVRACPVAMRYYGLLHPLRWDAFPERLFQSGWRQAPTSYAAFVSACLVKLDRQMPYMSQLRDFLCEHPALVWLLGFTAQTRFDPDKVLPTHRHFTRMLRQIPNESLQYLLDETVRVLKSGLEDFGSSVSLDTKHILAWVQENNPKAYVSQRYNKAKQPAGDPDCRLGCKRRHNRNSLPDTPLEEATPASKMEVAEFYWGYASGVVATKIPDQGEFVLAELTQTFDRPDVSYFQPLMAAVERRLGQRPRFAAFDAAFDAFYVYEYFARTTDWHDAFAAVPLTARYSLSQFDADGHPLCAAGLSMIPAYTFTCRTTLVEHQRTHYVCPLNGVDCPIHHARAAKAVVHTASPAPLERASATRLTATLLYIRTFTGSALLPSA